MEDRADVPLVGGPVDGQLADVPLLDDGDPPRTLDQTWLWTTFGSDLLDVDVAGRYELEPVAGRGPPWLYLWVTA